MKRFEIFFGIIKVPIDLIMTILAFLAAYELRIITEHVSWIDRPIDYSVLPTIREYLIFSAAAAIALIIIFILGRMYTLRTTFRFSKEAKKTLILCGIWAMAIITYFFFTRSFPFSRLAILYSFTLTFFFIIFGRGLIRIIQRLFLRAGLGRRKLLFIGNNSITEELIKKLEGNLNYKIIGTVGDKNSKTKLKIMGEIKKLPTLIKRHKIDEVIQTKSDLSEAQAENILELCDLKHINYRFVPDIIEVRRTNIAIETISSIPIINLKPTPLDGWGKVIKRIFDIIGSTLGLVLLSPIMLIIAIAIKIDSKGPVIFSKRDDGSPVKRVGQRGKLIKFYKFRTMHPKTDSLRYTKLSKRNLRKDGPLVKIKDDPRITKVGRFLRAYSLDELPQLWNVLIGNISLVGPRPHLPEEVAQYKKHHHFVLTIKPGLSGLAQTSGRSDLSFEEEVRLDRFYIENWSLWFDLKLIFKTIGVLVRGYRE